jgi:hypothetical protein
VRAWRSKLDRLSGNGGPQTELELRLRSTEERLVDCRRARVEGDVRGGGVRIAFEDDLLIVADLKTGTKLYVRY